MTDDSIMSPDQSQPGIIDVHSGSDQKSSEGTAYSSGKLTSPPCAPQRKVEARESADKAIKDTRGSAVAPVIVLPNDVAAGKERPRRTGMLDAPPPSLQAGMPNNITGIVTNAPVSVPKLAAEQPVRVSSGSAQLVVSMVRPRYPAAARDMRIQGTVVVQAVIGKDGKIVSLHATSGHPLVIQAALDAVKQWQFRPYLLNGVPVEADTRINVNFVIKRN